MEGGRARLKCAMCFYSAFLPRSLMYHYVRNHRYDPRFFVTCAVEGCGATYRNWTSFKKHVQRSHRGELVIIHDDQALIQHHEEIPVFGEHNGDEGVEVNENQHGVDRYSKLQWQAAKFLLYIRDSCRTSHKAMLKVKEGVHHLMQLYTSLLQDEITNIVDPVTQTAPAAAIQEMFQQRFPCSDVFASVATKTHLNKFMMDELNMIEPFKIELGRELIWQRKPRVDLVEKTYSGYTIPLLKSLKRLLLNDQVRFCVDNPRQSVGTMRSILDGNYYKNHPFFSTNRNSLAIILYYDELEIVNPLGPKTHKMGMFYWTLANIYPEYRSTLQAINLLAVAKYAHIVKFGIDKILKSFVEDINALQTEGVTITINGEEKNYRGSLLVVTGDTPASAYLGGFKRAVSASRPCRRCMTDQDRWKLFFRERNFTLRDKDTHLDHIEAVLQEGVTQEVRKFWSKAYGVNERSILLDIDGFDVTVCLVQDVMHVLSEGVLEVATRVFLKFLVSNGYFSIDVLNERILHFEYGHLTKDKPSPILAEHLDNGLRQTSAQMICLCHVLPFLIQDLLIRENEDAQVQAQERLLCHTRMLQIANVCFAFEISNDDTNYLTYLIDFFLSKFKLFYPNAMVPKFHFLVHIANQIKQFGPARQHFCMRFEAAHAWYKGLMRVIRNLKNIPWTFTYRQESLRCSEIAAPPGEPSTRFLYQGHFIKNGQRYKVVDLQFQDLLFDQLGPIDRETCEVMVSPEVSIHGTTYRPGAILVVKCEDDDLPIFARVREIYVHNDQIFLLYKLYDTLGYYDTLNAYRVAVDADSELGLLNVKSLIHPFPLSLFTCQRFQYVVLFNSARTEFIN